jgi:hypothetical protein
MTDAELEPKQWAKWWKESGERELRQILFWRWDPIGVADEFPYTEEAYDGYVMHVASLLRDEASLDAVADYLGAVERDSMGIHETPRAEGTAARLPISFGTPGIRTPWAAGKSSAPRGCRSRTLTPTPPESRPSQRGRPGDYTMNLEEIRRATQSVCVAIPLHYFRPQIAA